MKNILTWVLSFTSCIAFAQSNFVTAFTAVQVKDSVLLQWTIGKGNTCSGIDIEKSTDSISFKNIGDIQGVCGSPDFETSYIFYDRNPAFNQWNYYRLVIPGNGYSNIVRVLPRDFSETQFIVYPTPAASNFTVQFENNNQYTYNLTLIDLTGKEVEKIQARADRFVVNTASLANGVYFFSVTDDRNNSFSGKVLLLGK